MNYTTKKKHLWRSGGGGGWQSQIAEHSEKLPSTGYYPPSIQVQVEKNYVENVTKITSKRVFSGTEIAGSGVLNYPNYSFEQCSLQIQGIWR